MGILSVLGSIGKAIGGTALGIGADAAGGAIKYNLQKKLNQQQFEHQKLLNAQQQQYARENADVQYERQRDFTSDSWLLNKAGMRNAGINTSFVDGSSNPTASVDAAASPSAGSAVGGSAPDFNFANSASVGVQSLTQLETANAQNALLKAETHNQEIKNAFEIQHQKDQVQKDFDEHKINEVTYNERMENLSRLEDTHESYVKQEDEKAKQAELETQIKDIQVKQENAKNEILGITKQLNEEQLKQAKFITEHQLDQYIADCKEQASRIRANNASAAASFASAAASKAQALLTNIQAKLERAKVPFADKIATYVASSAMNAAKKSEYDFKLSKLNYKTEKEWHSSESLSFQTGELLRNTLAGWLPFSASVSKSIK